MLKLDRLCELREAAKGEYYAEVNLPLKDRNLENLSYHQGLMDGLGQAMEIERNS